MKIALRILGLMAILITVVVVAALIYVNSYLGPFLRTKIETEGSKAIEGSVKVGAVTLNVFPTPSLAIAKLEFDSPTKNYRGEIERLNVSLPTSLSALIGKGSLGRLNVRVQKPQVVATLVEEENKNQEPEKDSPAATTSRKIELPKSPRDFGLAVKIENGSVLLQRRTIDGEQRSRTESVRLVNLDAAFDLESINQLTTTLKMGFEAEVERGDLKIGFPVKIAAPMSFDGLKFDLDRARGSIAGLDFQLRGRHDLIHEQSQWRLEAHVPNLAKLPVPPTFLPEGEWSGGANLKLTIHQPQPRAPWHAMGVFTLTNLHGKTKLVREDLTLDGQVKSRVHLSFTARPKPGQNLKASPEYDLKVDKAMASLDLSEAAISKKDLLQKPIGVPLKFDLMASGTIESLTVQKLDFRFAALELSAKGEVQSQPGQISQLDVRVNRTDLAGFEKFFPMLGSQPVRGSLELSGSLKGDLQNPESLVVTIKPLELDRIQAHVDWTSEDKTKMLRGPLSLDGKVILEAHGKDLKTADIEADIDLTKLSIDIREDSKDLPKPAASGVPASTFKKSAGVPFLFKALAKQKDQSIEVKRTDMTLGSSRMSATGLVKNPQAPDLDLRFSLDNLNLGELTQFSSKAETLKLVGKMTGSLSLGGRFDFAGGLEKSPLRANGKLKINLPKYQMAREPREEENTDRQAKTKKPNPPPEPLLPDWPVARQSRIETDLTIGHFQYGDDHFSDIAMRIILDRGAIEASGSVGQIFDGTMKVEKLTTRVDQATPSTTVTAEVKQVDLSQAAGFGNLEWKKLTKGRADGNLTATLAHPSLSDFAARSSATGRLKISNAYLSTISLDQLVNEKLLQIPGFGSKQKVNSGGVAAEISTQYALTNSKLAVNNFVFLTPERNELRATGTIGLDKSIDLKAVAFLAQTSIGGSIREANSDATGRFMIPLEIKGNLLEPKASIAQSAIEAVLKKTADHEINKATHSARAKVNEETQKQIDKAKDALRKKSEEALKGLFGN